MRRVLVFLCLLGAPPALSACQKEPDFDTRYDEVQDKIEAKAADLDKDIKTGDTGAEDGAEAPPSGLD